MKLATRYLLFACVFCALCGSVALADNIVDSQERYAPADNITEERGRYARMLVEDAQVAARRSDAAVNASRDAEKAYEEVAEALSKAAESQLLAWKSVDEEIALLRLSVRLLEIKGGNKTNEWNSTRLPLVANAGLFALESLTNESIEELSEAARLARNAQTAAKIALERQVQGGKTLRAEEVAAREKSLTNGTEELMKVAVDATSYAEVASRFASNVALQATVRARKALEKAAEVARAQERHENTTRQHTLYKVTLEAHQNTSKAMKAAESLLPNVRELVEKANKTAEKHLEVALAAAEMAESTHRILSYRLYLLEQMERKQQHGTVSPRAEKPPERKTSEPELSEELSEEELQTQEMLSQATMKPNFSDMEMEITVLIEEAQNVTTDVYIREPMVYTAQEVRALRSNVFSSDPEKKEKLEKARELMYEIDSAVPVLCTKSVLLPFAAACVAIAAMLA